MNELTVIGQPMELYRQSTDIASICKEMAVRCAVEIQGRRYIPVEVWQAIATAHSCVASSRDVQWVEKTDHSAGGFKAIGEIRRMSDGALISTAEGFVGDDEATWFGGEVQKDEWVNKRKTGNKITVTLPKRPDYAIRAMCQTRAMSRAGRSAFAHVVVLMNAGLDTAPAEEAEADNIDYTNGEHRAPVQKREPGEPEHTTDQNKPPVTEDNWREVLNTAAKPEGKFYKPVGELPSSYLEWFYSDSGTGAYWKKNPREFGADQKRVHDAMQFAIAAKKAAKENAEVNQERKDPEPKQEPKAPAGAVAMLETMIKAKKIDRAAFMETAQELEFIPDLMSDLTDAQAEKIIANFQNLVETTEAK